MAREAHAEQARRKRSVEEKQPSSFPSLPVAGGWGVLGFCKEEKRKKVTMDPQCHVSFSISYYVTSVSVFNWNKPKIRCSSEICE
ncbi:hypothetical protein H5410_037187 [Solanum commersonii]|uniref:Uncharacterized protein n=1 Tax=Solanum commersonii TaxID=4109 RepID=A0A9J5Y5K7_SOLCO|nr:hypothetical protein H5410_037187 [Solanum commersonii]